MNVDEDVGEKQYLFSLTLISVSCKLITGIQSDEF